MISKYLTMDPIPWLTDGVNPAVTYLVKNEILQTVHNEEIYKNLIKSDLTHYFIKNCSNGILGDFKNLDLFYRGSIWFFLLAVESGYKNSLDFISYTSDNICKKIQLNNGGFKFNHKTSDAVGCRSGNMVYSLLKSGITDSRTDSGIKWIVENQRHDGGWLHCPFAGKCDMMRLIFLNKFGNGLKYEIDDKVLSCPVASYYCLKALIQFNNVSNINSISKAADFFIKNNFFIKTNEQLLCGNRVNYQKLGYPIMAQYDYISGLILIYQIKNRSELQTGELFNNIIKKQNPDGTWNNENISHGMINEKYGMSRWTTLNALRLVNIIVEQEKSI